MMNFSLVLVGMVSIAWSQPYMWSVSQNGGLHSYQHSALSWLELSDFDDASTTPISGLACKNSADYYYTCNLEILPDPSPDLIRIYKWNTSTGSFVGSYNCGGAGFNTTSISGFDIANGSNGNHYFGGSLGGYPVVHWFNEATFAGSTQLGSVAGSIRGLALNSTGDSLYCLIQDSSNYLRVYRARTSTWVFVSLISPVTIPDEASTANDCGFSNGHLYFSITDADQSGYPYWDINLNSGVLTPVTQITWSDISGAITGLDICPVEVGIEDSPNVEIPHSRLSSSPNPFMASVTISGPSDAIIQIFDISGRTILEDTFAENYIWNAAEESPGIYLVRVIGLEATDNLVLVKL